jgi:putative oxidoreductase
MKPGEWIRPFLIGSRSWEEFSILLARISLGVFFAISGGNKLFVASRNRQMYETLSGAGIPFPRVMTYVTSSVEFLGGCLLIIGLLSSLCCAALIVQMIVAIITVRVATIPGGLSFLNWLDDFLYLPEATYIVILIWLICAGPGRFSMDARVFRVSRYPPQRPEERDVNP